MSSVAAALPSLAVTASNHLDGIDRVLVVVAHPDDVDFGSAGTMASWSAQGVEITYCIVTDGDQGGFDEAVSRPEMVRIRHREQTAAAAVVGVTDVRFLGHPDGRLFPSLELRRDISRVIRQVRPQRVLCQSPERNYDCIFASHPDHLVAGEMALGAVYPDARNPFAHPELLLEEGLQPFAVPEVWMMSLGGANRHVDITETFDRKLAALQAHVSQTGHMTDLEDRLRQWATANAVEAAFPDGHLAEAFRAITTA